MTHKILTGTAQTEFIKVELLDETNSELLENRLNNRVALQPFRFKTDGENADEKEPEDIYLKWTVWFVHRRA